MRSVLIIHGVNDKIVPFAGAPDMVNRTKEVGVVCELYAIEGAGHGVNLSKAIDGITLSRQNLRKLAVEMLRRGSQPVLKENVDAAEILKKWLEQVGAPEK
ncbi:MAG TPA: hypothetical protein VM260_25720 [Pirellula sp.]|nr:hypothetical protein [Pirellula sp.]